MSTNLRPSNYLRLSITSLCVICLILSGYGQEDKPHIKKEILRTHDMRKETTLFNKQGKGFLYTMVSQAGDTLQKTQSSYDEQGRLLRQISFDDNRISPTFDRTYVYNEKDKKIATKNNLTGVTVVDVKQYNEKGDPLFDFYGHYEYEYDDAGRMTLKTLRDTTGKLQNSWMFKHKEGQTTTIFLSALEDVISIEKKAIDKKKISTKLYDGNNTLTQSQIQVLNKYGDPVRIVTSNAKGKSILLSVVYYEYY